jgi:DNA-binding GntR family transcriptional regulator
MIANGVMRVADSEDTTLAQQAYVNLKQRIVSLALAPGATISESDLQLQLGVGRTPLRDALLRLTHDGLLRIYPRRAIVVPKLGLAEIRELFEVRLALEPAAAALAAERLTGPELERFRQLAAELHKSRQQPDAKTFLDADQKFHRAVASFSRNALLAEYIDHLQTLNLWLWNQYFDAHAVRRADLFAHEPIIEALLVADARSAQLAMSEHIAGSKEQLLAGL